MVGALAAALITTLATLADASDHGSSKLTAGGLKNGTMELVMIPAGEPALAGSCLDGSPFGMYQLLNESSPNWIIYFDGGIMPAICCLPLAAAASLTLPASPPLPAACSASMLIYRRCTPAGGACENVAGCVSRGQPGNNLGSSINWPKTDIANGLLEKDCSINPWCSWNMVRLPYCDGSVWCGTQTKKTAAGYIASGHFNAVRDGRALRDIGMV